MSAGCGKPTETLETQLKKLFHKLCFAMQDLADRRGGPDLVEYALILTLASLAAVGHVRMVTVAVDTLFANISNTLV
jgi:Flp pilus assembly pilin Flp